MPNTKSRAEDTWENQLELRQRLVNTSAERDLKLNSKTAGRSTSSIAHTSSTKVVYARRR